MKWLIVAFILLFSLESYAANEGGVSAPEYSTIVIFGDSQQAMEDYRISGSGAERYAEMDAAIDWIFDNAERENIEFVLHVGDMISAGIALPPYGAEIDQCDFENGAPYAANSATCFAIGVEATCKTTSGCFWNADPADGPAQCGSCDLVERTSTEWAGFELLWDRFLPGGDTANGIPALTVRGNHDNVGTENATDADREPQGYNQRFSTAYWDALDGDFGPRQYEHVASYSDAVNGDGHAWLMRIGTRPILVVAISCCTSSGIDDAQEAWAISTMAAYSTTPAILLVHHADAVDDLIVNIAGEVAPNLFAVFGGHDGDRLKRFVTDGNSFIPDTRTMLKSETDWTNAGSSDLDISGRVQNDYITLVRFYGNIDEIAVEDFSVKSGLRNNDASNRVEKQVLDITPGEPLVSPFVSLQESTTFGPGGSIFDLTTRVAPPAYIPPPSSDPADYTNENDTLKLSSCSSDDATWESFKTILSGAADSTFIWLPQSCRMKIFLDATKGDSAEFSIANTKDEITIYCGNPAVCRPEIVYRAATYPTSMETDGTAGDGKFAFGEQPQKHVFEVGTGRISTGSVTQACDWDAAFRDAYSFPSHVVKLDSADCQITNTGATAWGPGDVARVRTSRITGTGITQPQWMGRIVCVKTYGTAAANDGTLYPNDPTGLCAGITDDNSVRFGNPLPWDLNPTAYYWGDPANVGDSFNRHPSDTSGPTTYAATSGHVVEQLDRAGSTRCDIVGPGICGNGTGTDTVAENIWFYGIAWSVKPQYVGGMFSAWKRAFGGGHYLGGPLNDSGRVAAVTFGKESPAWEVGDASLHSMDWWGTASNSKCFGEVIELTVAGAADLVVKVAADSSTRCWNGTGTDTPNWGEPEIAFSDEVADSRLAGKRFLMTKGAFNDCVDLYNSGGPPQNSGTPDGNCDDPATIGSWNLTITGLNGSNPDGTGVPIDTTPGGIASNIDRFAGATYYVQSFSSGIRTVNTWFENPLQHAIDQGCVGCVYSANHVQSDPAQSIRGRGPFRHGTSGSCASIHELSSQDHAVVPYDTSNGEPNRHGEGCGHVFYKMRFFDSGTLTWPLGTATGSDYTPSGAGFWVRATSQNGAANDKWSLIGNVGDELFTGLAGTGADIDFNDNYDGDNGAPPQPPYLLHDLVALRNRSGSGTNMDDNFAGATNPTTTTDVGSEEFGESDTVPAGALQWGPEIGLEPSALYLTPAIEFWCEESGPIGQIGAYYDDLSNLAANKKNPAEIRYRIAKGLGGTCTPVPPVVP